MSEPKPYGDWSLEFASMTGNIVDGQVECVTLGTSFFARPVFSTAFQSIPSKAWLQKYSKQFYAIVTYEKGIKERPLFLGVAPINSENYQGANIEDKHKINTQKFSILIDDTNDACTITRFAGGTIALKGTNAYIQAETINLGDEEANEPAVLGNSLVSKIRALVTILKAAVTMTVLGPQPFMGTTQVALQELSDSLDEILSETNKLN